jgi:Rod binding domain-containing protein
MSPGLIQPVSFSPQIASPAGEAAAPRKLVHAAQQFEALLLNTLLGPLEKTFSSVPGQKDMPGGDSYAHLGTQALASGLAASGGLGIAQMIVRNIMKHSEVTGQQGDNPGVKVRSLNSR